MLEAAELLGIDIDIHVENPNQETSDQSLKTDKFVNLNRETFPLENIDQILPWKKGTARG